MALWRSRQRAATELSAHRAVPHRTSLTFRRVGLEVGVLLVGAGTLRYRGQARDLDASAGRHDLLGQFYAQLTARRLLAVFVGAAVAAAAAARNAARLAIGVAGGVPLVLACCVKWSAGRCDWVYRENEVLFWCSFVYVKITARLRELRRQEMRTIHSRNLNDFVVCDISLPPTRLHYHAFLCGSFCLT